jgi:hypothetical protein
MSCVSIFRLAVLGKFLRRSYLSRNVRIQRKYRGLSSYHRRRPLGVTGDWLIDPQDFTVSAAGNIFGATLSALLVTNSVTISTNTGTDTVTAEPRQ